MVQRWQCSVCGYIHVGAEPPESCPVCGADRSRFVRLEAAAPAPEAGLWATFKLHPVVAHFPAGLLPTAAFLGLLSVALGEPAVEEAAFWLVMLATAAVPVSIGSGLYDWQKERGGAKAVIYYKKIALAVTLLLLGVIATVLRYGHPALTAGGDWRSLLYLVCVLGMLGCVVLLGHYGAILAAQGVAQAAPAPNQPAPEWYRALVTQAPDAILVADRDGVIRLWNQGAERIFGTPAAQAIGQSLDLIIPENLRQRHWQGWGQAMRSGASRYGASELLKVPALRADGSRFSAEFSLVMLKDESGAVSAVAAILRDVTEQREREKALKTQLEDCLNKQKG